MLTKNDKKFIKNLFRENNDSLVKDMVDLFNANNSYIKDVDKRLIKKIDDVDKKLTKKIYEVDQKLSKKIDDVDKKLTKKIDDVDQKLTKKIDDVDKRLNEKLDKVLDYLKTDDRSIEDHEERIIKLEKKLFTTTISS